MDTAHWPQEIVVKPIEEIVVTTNTCPKPQAPPGLGGEILLDQRKLARPQREEALNCPRCHSINTKFCYYNNYSLTQPRYFCKNCKRYWTQGGSLRNIPVGGGIRKNKRPTSISCSSSPPSPHKTIKLNLDQNNPIRDFNLAFKNISEFATQQNHKNNSLSASTSSNAAAITTTSTTTTSTSHLELLTSSPSSLGSRGLMNSNHHFMHLPVSIQPDPNTIYGSCGGFPILDFKPSLNFSFDGMGSNEFSSLHHQNQTRVGGDSGGRLLFPFENLKQVSTTAVTTTTVSIDHGSDKEQQRDHNSNGYWSGMLGEGRGSW